MLRGLTQMQPLLQLFHRAVESGEVVKLWELSSRDKRD